MALYIVRHGETDYNREKRFQSRLDIPLNQTGLNQARAIRREFEDRRVVFHIARCSPLSRARATAEIILEGTGLAAGIEPLFIELDFGGFDGRLETDLQQEYGEAFTRWRESHYTLTSPAGGENIITGAERVRPALEALVSEADGGNILIVAHQAVNMAMKVVLSGRTDVASAQTFKQANDQVDIWDPAAGMLIEQFRVSAETDHGTTSPQG